MVPRSSERLRVLTQQGDTQPVEGHLCNYLAASFLSRGRRSLRLPKLLSRQTDRRSCRFWLRARATPSTSRQPKRQREEEAEADTPGTASAVMPGPRRGAEGARSLVIPGLGSSAVLPEGRCPPAARSAG